MKYSFFDLGLQWASNTGQTETPTAQEVRDHIQSTFNYSAKRVKDKDVADFVLGVQTALEDVVEEKPKRTYKKKSKEVEVPVEEADLHIDTDSTDEDA